MQIIMMPFILLLIFNTWHLFNFANGMKKQSSDKLKKMYSLLKKDFFHQFIFHSILICLLIFINIYYFTDILMNQLKFDFYGLDPLRVAEEIPDSSLSPLISLLIMHIAISLLILLLT